MPAFVQDANDLTDLEKDLGECSVEVEASTSEFGAQVNRLLEQIQAAGSAVRAKVEDARRQIIKSEHELQSTEEGLLSAQTALSACLSQPSDEDGSPPDCSSEESALSGAQEEHSRALAAVEEARELLALRLKALDQTELLTSRANAEADLSLSSIERQRVDYMNRSESARSFLRDAVLHIEAYSSRSEGTLSTVSPAVSVSHGGGNNVLLPDLSAFGAVALPRSGVVTPRHLKARFELSSGGLSDFARKLIDTDPKFTAEIQRRRTAYEKASGPADRALVMAQMMRTTSALFGERLVLAGLGPLGSQVVTQERTVTPDGETTITDAVLYGVKMPIVLGRGKGLFVPQGGTLRCEVKARRSGSFAGEKRHLNVQMRGGDPVHQRLAIVTRDLHDLEEEEEFALREVARTAGGHTLALLPRKEALDAVLWELVTNRSGA